VASPLRLVFVECSLLTKPLILPGTTQNPHSLDYGGEAVPPEILTGNQISAIECWWSPKPWFFLDSQKSSVSRLWRCGHSPWNLNWKPHKCCLVLVKPSRALNSNTHHPHTLGATNSLNPVTGLCVLLRHLNNVCDPWLPHP
jgi:hypothetical protein